MKISKFAGFRYRRYAVATRLLVLAWTVYVGQIYFIGEHTPREGWIIAASILVVALPGLVLASGFSASAENAFAGRGKHMR
jgi:hypothetical protein